MRTRPGAAGLRELADGRAGSRVAGGRAGWARLAMTAVGVGLGVALLLLAAAIPTPGRGPRRRGAPPATSTATQPVARGADTLLSPRPTRSSGASRSAAGSCSRRARRPAAARGDAGCPAPARWWSRRPGRAARRAATGHCCASGCRYADRRHDRRGRPGRARRARLLPRQRRLTDGRPATARIDLVRRRASTSEGLDPGPAAARASSSWSCCCCRSPSSSPPRSASAASARDRRLAALRLVGADARDDPPDRGRRGARRRACSGSSLGGRSSSPWPAGSSSASRCWDVSFFPADFRPGPGCWPCWSLSLVPAGAVAVTLLALRRVVVEPLGVVRRSGDRAPPAVVAAAAAGGRARAALPGDRRTVERETAIGEYQVRPGGVACCWSAWPRCCPWLVEAVVRRLGGGGVAWQLAVRRLQLDSGTAARGSTASRSRWPARSRCRCSSPASSTT